MTSSLNFRKECLYKYDQETYDKIIDLFYNFPLAAIINKDFLCLHGGISPSWKSIKDLNKVDRVIEPPVSGIVCDILWADPAK